MVSQPTSNRSASRRDQGRKRPNNEDFVAFFEPDDPQELQASGCLYIVADGVGGASLGERASQYAAQKVLYEYYRYPQMPPSERLMLAMRQASNDIFNFAEQSDHFTRMATTMVAAVVLNNSLTVANVGDSRAYLIRAGEAQQITRDHSLVGEMVRDGTMSEEEALSSKAKNRLTRSLGGEADVHVDIFMDIPLQAGDRVLLCSDGLTRYALREDIARLAGQGSPAEVVERAVDYANQNGGADNVSVIAIDTAPSVGSSPIVGPSPASLIAHGQAPQPVSWDDMVTEPGIAAPVSKPKARRRSKYPTIPKRYIPIGIMGISMLCVMGVAAIVIASGIFNPQNSTPESNLPSPSTSAQTKPTSTEFGTSILSPTLTSTPPYEITSTPTPEKTVTPSLTPAKTDTQTLAPTETPSVSPTITITPNIMPTQSTENPGRCEYTVKANDTLSAIATELGITDYTNVTCAPVQPQNPGHTLCVDPTNLNEYKIDEGWALIFQNVLPSICSSNQGTPLQ